MANRKVADDRVRFAINKVKSYEYILTSYAVRRPSLVEELERAAQRLAQLDEDYRLAPQRLKEAKAELAQCKAVLRKFDETGAPTPEKRQPKTKQERMIAKRARLLLELARIENQIED